MPASTLLCPACGAENQRERSVCFKCYSPLHQRESSPPSSAAAVAAPRPAVRPAVVPVRPSELLGDFLANLRETPLYEYGVLFLALIALTWAVIAAANFNALPTAYAHLTALGLMSLGMTAAILVGGVDLSLGPTAAVAGALALVSRPFGAMFALTVALVAGLVLGLVNGILIARKERASATIITLCTGSAAAALMLAYNLGDYSVEGFTSFQRLAVSGWAGIPFSILLAIVAVAAGNILLNGVVVKSGNSSSNPVTFSNSEIVSAYTFSGFLAALAGSLLIAGNATPREIVFSAWYLMPLAAVLIGGALLRERKATVPAAFFGALVLGAMTSHMQTLGLPAVNFFLAAVIIVVASSLDSWKQISVAKVIAFARENPFKATQGTAGFCVMFMLLGGISSNLISRVPADSAILIQSSGKVLYRSKGSDLWSEARGRVVFHDGDDVYTDPSSAALLKLSDDSVIKLTANTQLRLEQLGATQSGHSVTRLFIAMGRLYTKVKETLEGVNEFEVQTPTAVAAVRGTEWSVASTEGGDYVSVHKGIVAVASAGAQVTVSAGNETTVPRNAPPAPPREMSDAEKSAWAREVPVLQNPLQQRLWESNLSGDFMRDDFDSGQIDPALWYLRAGAEAKDVIVREAGGYLSVAGLPPQRAGYASYGAVTASFPQGSCQASVDARVKRGEGSAVFRLADATGRAGSVCIVLDSQKGCDLVGPSGHKVINRHVKPFGDERDAYHRLSLSYDAGARIVRANVNSMSLGYVETEFGGDMHLELVYEGQGLREGIDCRFDNFDTNVPMPRSQVVQTIVAAINPASSGQARTMLVASPLSKKSEGLASVNVQYPRKSLAASTRLLVQGNGSGDLTRQKANNVWIYEDRGSTPGMGDYIFRFRSSDRRQWTSWQRVTDAEFPQITNLRDDVSQETLSVAWDPVRGADSYWLEVVDAKVRKSLFNSSLVTEAHAVLKPTGLRSGASYFVVLVAHIPDGAESMTSLQQWQQVVEYILPSLAPAGNAFLNANSPAGKDKFAVQSGELRKW